MKITFVGIVLLCTLALACVANAKPGANNASAQTTHRSEQPADSRIQAPAPAQNSQDATVMTREEADSFATQSDSLLAQSGVGEINVGSIDGNDLVYILVVVLLVVVILAVVR